MKFIYWSVTALIALVLVMFAVSNLGSVELKLEPLPDSIQAPLYLVVLATLAIGFVIGEAAAWIAGGRRRAEARALRRRMDRLERDVGAPPQSVSPTPPERP